MNERLSLAQVALLAGYAAAMAGGQILFKLASARFAGAGSFAERAVGLFINGYFLLALALYLALTVLWVWILSFTPLSRAYPFVALAFVLTPVLAAALFGEPLTWRLLAGIGLILGGLLLVAG
jgi:drug/metabolite transporter (DMT)-like permease